MCSESIDSFYFTNAGKINGPIVDDNDDELVANQYAGVKACLDIGLNLKGVDVTDRPEPPRSFNCMSATAFGLLKLMM